MRYLVLIAAALCLAVLVDLVQEGDRAAQVEAQRAWCAQVTQQGLEAVALGQASVNETLAHLKKEGC